MLQFLLTIDMNSLIVFPKKEKLEENDFKTKPLRYIRPGKGVWRDGRGRGIWRTVFTRRLAN